MGAGGGEGGGQLRGSTHWGTGARGGGMRSLVWGGH